MWQEAIPLGEAFLRSLNADPEKFADELNWALGPSGSSLIAETGFELFDLKLRSTKAGSQWVPEVGEELAWGNARRFLSRFGDFQEESVAREIAVEFAREVADRLLWYALEISAPKDVQVRPGFRGCGTISECSGDILAARTLIEVKCVSRDFRIGDLRQLLVYCALDAATGERTIDRAVLLNPRRGTAVGASVEQIARAAAGTSATELLASIARLADQGQLY